MTHQIRRENMPKTYRVGIVGCGSIARSHASGYLRVENVQMVAAADPHPFAREYFCEEFGVQNAYASLEEMCKSESLDIVSICVWHLLHPDCTIDVSNLGVPGIICEKPMAVGLGEAERMLSVCQENGTKLVVSHQRRFTPGWEKARALMRAGAIGEPVMCHIQVAAGLLNWATHAIDGVRFVMDDPTTVWVMGAVERQTDRYERDVATEDCCMGLVTFGNGAQALIQSDLDRPNEGAGYFQIRGSEGMMAVTERSVRLFTSRDGGWVDIPIDANDERQAIGGRKARDTVEIMMALFESARQHQVIRLPLKEMAYPLDLMIEEGKLPVAILGKNDIRAFLNPEGMDEAEYRRLRAAGEGHSGAMRRLYDLRK
jgi:predicted dehydrogenase